MNDQSNIPIRPHPGTWSKFKAWIIAMGEAIDCDGPESEILLRLRKLEDRITVLELKP